MMWAEADIAAWAHRIIGSGAGTIVTLAFVWPKTTREFVQLTVVSFITGTVMSYPAREWLGWPATLENRIAASAGCAFFALVAGKAAYAFVRRSRPDGE